MDASISCGTFNGVCIFVKTTIVDNKHVTEYEIFHNNLKYRDMALLVEDKDVSQESHRLAREVAECVVVESTTYRYGWKHSVLEGSKFVIKEQTDETGAKDKYFRLVNKNGEIENSNGFIWISNETCESVTFCEVATDPVIILDYLNECLAKLLSALNKAYPRLSLFVDTD